MKCFSFFTLLFHLAVIGFGQSKKENDSLLIRYNETKIDTEKVKLLSTICKDYLITGNYRSAISYANTCISIIQNKLNDSKKCSERELFIFNHASAQAHSVLGMAYSNKGEYKDAKKNLQLSLDIYSGIKDKSGMAKVYNNIANMEFDNGHYTEAIKYHLESIKLKEEMGNIIGVATSIGNLANVYSAIGKFDQARVKYNEVLAIYKKEDHKMGIGNILNNIGLVCEDQMKYDSAIYYYNESLKYRNELNDLQGVAANYSNIGGTYVKEKKFDLAVDNFLKSIKLKSKIGDLLGLGTAYIDLSIAYSELNKNQDAVFYANKGFEIIKKTESIQDMKTACETLANIYAKAKDYQSAFEFQKLLSEAKDSLAKINNMQIISELSTKYETEKKEKENQLLQVQNQLSNKTIQDQKTFSYFIITGLLLALALAFFIFRGLKQQRAANQIISEQKLVVEQQKLIVEKQKELVEESQKEVLDSIHYAKRIQTALITSERYIEKALNKLQNNG